MKIKEIYLIVFPVFIIGLFCGLFIDRGLVKKPVVSSQSAVNSEKHIKSNDTLFPWLNLPVEYFSNKDVRWGSAGNGNGDKITDYTQVALGNGTVYQSYPTTVTTIKQYSGEVKPLRIRSFDEALKEFSKDNPDGSWETVIKENYQKFGNLLTNYLPIYVIEKIGKFDVDNDGVPETIVTYNFAGRADAGSYQTDIIKGNNIVFSANEDRSAIVPADTASGFYVEWGDTNENGGRCCPEGFFRTRFIYKDGKFEPIYEQEVKYLKVGKEVN